MSKRFATTLSTAGGTRRLPAMTASSSASKAICVASRTSPDEETFPWPNPEGRLIECFFSILTRKLLQSGEFSSREDLVMTMLNFIKHHSENANPFKWVYDAKVTA